MIELERTVPARVTITEVQSDRTFRGTLPNGRDIFIFVQRMTPAPQISIGDAIIAELSVGDFSRGRFARLADDRIDAANA